MFLRCGLYVGVMIIVASIIPTCMSNASKSLSAKQAALLENLLKDYNPRIRPVGSANTTINGQYTTDPPPLITVNMYVLAISEVDDKDMDFTIQVYLRQEWNDNRLKFNDDRGSVPFLTLTDASKIWHSDLFVNNEKEGFQHHLLVPNVFLRIYPNGNVLYSQRLTLTMSCAMSLHYFPFDRQTCDMNLESYGSATKDLQLQWKEGSPVQIAQDVYLTTFSVVGHETKKYVVQLTSGEYSVLHLGIHLQRVWGSFILTLFIPCIMLVSVSWTCFWLDSGAIIARALISVTTLFTLFMHVAAFSASQVAVPYVRSVDVWTGTCLTFVFLAFLETIVVNYLSRSGGGEKQEGGGGGADVAQREVEEGVPMIEVTSDAVAPAKENGRGPIGSLKRKADQFRNRLTALPTWSAKLDVLSRIVFPIGFVSFVLVYALRTKYATE